MPPLLLFALALALAGCRAGVSRGEIYFADGLERLALGDSVGALELLEKANYELGDDARVLFHIGRLAAAEGTIEARARGAQALLRAVDLEPRVGAYRAALGALLRRQRFTGASSRMLAEAVRLDPALEHAWLLLGINAQEKYFRDLEEDALLDSAQSCYVQALQANSGNLEARFRLAFLKMRQMQLDAARELLTPYVYGRQCPGRFGLLLSAVEFRAQEFARAQELAEQVLECMTWPEREPYVGLRYLIHPDSVGVYKLLSDVQRDSLSRHYWWSQDPTPTSMVNERFVEQISRTVDANFYFSVPHIGKQGYRTDRGEVYQRYGPPDDMFPVLGSSRPSWTWRYGNGVGATYFRFFDTYLNGDFMRARRTAGSSFQIPIAFEVTPAATRIRFKSPEGEWHYVMRFFRGTEDRTAVEIAYELIPERKWNNLAVEAAGWRGPGSMVAHKRLIVGREQLHPVSGGRLVGRLRLEVPAEEIFLGLQAMALRRAVAADVEPTRVARTHGMEWVAFGRDTLDIEDLHGGALAMSDVMLAHVVRDGKGGPFDMGGIIAVPRVGTKIASRRVHLYFEIYPSAEILDESRAIAVSYEVRSLPPKSWKFWDQFKPDFRRRMDPDRRPAVQATFLFQPTERIEKQQLTIDVSVLEPGPYMLNVQVIDSVSGQRAQRAVPLELIPEVIFDDES